MMSTDKNKFVWSEESDNKIVELIKECEALAADQGINRREIGSKIWSSFANVNWINTSNLRAISCSFRYAGDLIAEAFGEGDYIDWYCSGRPATVWPLFAKVMRKNGWIYDDGAEICDEPKCYQTASCGYPAVCGTYRHSCGEHYSTYRKNDE